MFTTAQAAGGELAPDLTELWRVAFGDEDGYISLFLEHCAAPHRTFVALDSGRAVAALYALPFTLRGDRQLRAAYIYSVATLPAFRGRGLSTGLLSYVHGELALRGYDAALLVPAEPTLFDFYARQGYVPFGGRAVINCDVPSVPPMAATPAVTAVPLSTEAELAAAAAELYLRRERFLARTANGRYGSWDIPALTYRLREHHYLGGQLCWLPDGGYALPAVAGEGVSRRLFIREIGFGAGGAAAALRAVTAESGVLTPPPLTASLPQSCAGELEHFARPCELTTERYAMLHMLSSAPPPPGDGAFFGLALD